MISCLDPKSGCFSHVEDVVVVMHEMREVIKAWRGGGGLSVQIKPMEFSTFFNWACIKNAIWCHHIQRSIEQIWVQKLFQNDAKKISTLFA